MLLFVLACIYCELKIMTLSPMSIFELDPVLPKLSSSSLFFICFIKSNAFENLLVILLLSFRWSFGLLSELGDFSKFVFGALGPPFNSAHLAKNPAEASLIY